MRAVFVIAVFVFITKSQAQQVCTGASYSRHMDSRLRCGIFKTQESLNPLECQKQCTATLHCFSVNSYPSENGSTICELIKGTRETFQDCFTAEPYKEHNELMDITTCSPTGTCSKNVTRKVLAGGWYQLGSSAFKHFKTKNTWHDANDTCSANQASLATIHSELENRFFVGVFLKSIQGTNIAAELKPLKYWRLDGTDKDVVLFGGAYYDKENAALRLPGTAGSYATTPAVAISTISFSIAVWVKMDSPTSNSFLYSYWSSPYIFNFVVHPRIQFQARQTNTNRDLLLISAGNVMENTWTHATVTWNRPSKQLTLYQDGVKVALRTLADNDFDLPSPTRSTFDVGFKRDSRSVIKALMRELMVFDRPLDSQEVLRLKVETSFLNLPRVWIGQPAGKYHNLLPNLTISSNCLSARAWGKNFWDKVSCTETLEFVCKKQI